MTDTSLFPGMPLSLFSGSRSTNTNLPCRQYNPSKSSNDCSDQKSSTYRDTTITTTTSSCHRLDQFQIRFKQKQQRQQSEKHNKQHQVCFASTTTDTGTPYWIQSFGATFYGLVRIIIVTTFITVTSRYQKHSEANYQERTSIFCTAINPSTTGRTLKSKRRNPAIGGQVQLEHLRHHQQQPIKYTDSSHHDNNNNISNNISHWTVQQQEQDQSKSLISNKLLIQYYHNYLLKVSTTRHLEEETVQQEVKTDDDNDDDYKVQDESDFPSDRPSTSPFTSPFSTTSPTTPVPNIFSDQGKVDLKDNKTNQPSIVPSTIPPTIQSTIVSIRNTTPVPSQVGTIDNNTNQPSNVPSTTPTAESTIRKEDVNNKKTNRPSNAPSVSPTAESTVGQDDVNVNKTDQPTSIPSATPTAGSTVGIDDGNVNKTNRPTSIPSTTPTAESTILQGDVDDDKTNRPSNIPSATPTTESTLVSNRNKTPAPDKMTTLPTLFYPGEEDDANVDTEQVVASCAAHPECSSLGLAGECCPNEYGLFLLCCDSDSVILSEQPSSVPSALPSALPSSAPKQTIAPSKNPITLPPVNPTKRPITNRPSEVPSATPIVEQQNPTKPSTNSTTTLKPTSSPKAATSKSPSQAPKATTTTKSPSQAPKAQPGASTVNPTKTLEPTSQYLYNKTSLSTPDVVMQFTLSSRRLQNDDSSNSEPFSISEACEAKWRTYVEERIEEEVDENVAEYEELNVNVDNITASKRSGLLLLSYNVLIDIRSDLVTNEDAIQYIEGPFDTNEEKDDTITYLKTTNCSEFANVQWVTVSVPNKQTSGVEQNPDKNTRNSQSQLGLIVGLSAAIGAVIMITIAFIIVKTRKRSRHRLEDEGEQYSPVFDTMASGNGGSRKDFNYVSEIGIDANQDVSTLGDPFPPDARINRIGDGGDDNDLSTIASNDIEYDYRKAYLDTAQSTSMLSDATGAMHPQEGGGSKAADDNDIRTMQDDGKSKTGQSVNTFTRYNSVQEPYEVLAPPGLLGLVIESDHDGGFPIVHSIKKDSVLYGVVKEGDCVLSIDGQDVSSMNAGAASMLIASKKNQDVRTFVFSRIMTP